MRGKMGGGKRGGKGGGAARKLRRPAQSGSAFRLRRLLF
ncbi:hypothetical protein GEOBRER4_n3164 [Citrifermentans bremense]|uniref:Uncharacterized protein n=1 Tax=Citrifermentans bremense TaxID=60035 RepID=A0A7R7FSH7_9BACT|nr:hypothetical protein GEOBRER4_n3164 [Citrifermentans bremense]